MEKVELAKNGPCLSPIVAGVMKWGVWGADLNTHQVSTLIDQCVEVDITSFDHADIYGNYTTEALFGTALAELGSSFRQRIQLVSKCGIRLKAKERPANRLKAYDSSKAYILQSVEQSLKDLRTDYLDLLLIHRPDPLMQPEEVAAAFDELRSAGKVLHFGVSNFTPSQFTLLQQHTELVTNQVACSALHLDPIFDGTFDQLQGQQKRPMIWAPFQGGEYFNETSSQGRRLRYTVQQIDKKYDHPGEDLILLAWLLSHPVGMLPILGTTKIERLRDALLALKMPLDRQDWFEILEASQGHEVA